MRRNENESTFALTLLFVSSYLRAAVFPGFHSGGVYATSVYTPYNHGPSGAVRGQAGRSCARVFAVPAPRVACIYSERLDAATAAQTASRKLVPCVDTAPAPRVTRATPVCNQLLVGSGSAHVRRPLFTPICHLIPRFRCAVKGAVVQAQWHARAAQAIG